MNFFFVGKPQRTPQTHRVLLATAGDGDVLVVSTLCAGATHGIRLGRAFSGEKLALLITRVARLHGPANEKGMGGAARSEE